MCVRERVCVCVCVCVRQRVCVCSFIHHFIVLHVCLSADVCLLKNMILFTSLYTLCVCVMSYGAVYYHLVQI